MIRRFLLSALLLLACLALSVPGLSQDDRPTRNGPLRVLGLDDRPKLREDIERLALEARRDFRAVTRVDWRQTAHIVWVDDEAEYLRLTGKMPEFTAAAASSQRHLVWINASAWSRSDPEVQRQIITHEMGHLLVGNLPGGRRLPLWAEEGMVQHLAGEWTWERAWQLARAHAFGAVPRLESLEEEFPTDPERQALAYAVSYRAVEEIALELGGEEEKGRGFGILMARLASPESGPALREQMWDPDERDRWNSATTRALGNRVANMIMIASSGALFWFIIMALVLWAWVKKRRRRSLLDKKEEDEEAWSSSLTENDVQDVWGDREGRFKTTETPWERLEREREEQEER